MSKKSDITFFLPTRKGSKRVINKNTKRFANFNGGLFELKLTQLIKSNKLTEIIVSSNDEICLEIANEFLRVDKRIKIDKRPESLCLDSTNISDLVQYVPTITNSEHILWGHVTTPMVDHKIYDDAIENYQEQLNNKYDSLVSVSRLQNFLLNKKSEIINNNTNIEWPRTQDLEILFEINHAIFLTSRNNYMNLKNRIGKKPYIYEMDKIHSIDVDWEDDFLIAESIYEKLNNI